MEGSKFIDALRQLATRERTKFMEFIYSPFFNKNRKVRRLASYCQQFAPDFRSPGLKKTTVFSAVFGKAEAYNEYRINNIISEAMKLLYQYLAQLQWQKEEADTQTYLLEELVGRQMERHISYCTRRLHQLQEEKQAQQGHRYFFRAYLLAEQEDRYALQHGARGYSPHLQEMSDALDHYYWSNKLRIACDMASRNKVIKAGYQCRFVEPILQACQAASDGLSQQPILQLYFAALQMLETEARQHYQELRQLLARYQDEVPREELADLYDYAQNYCVKMINSGHTQYYDQILDLYKAMLDRNILLRQGFLTQWSYINIVTAGIRLQDFEWTEWFIRTYREYLAPEVSDNVYNYNLAALYFEKKAYDRALQALQDVEFSDAFYHLAAKLIQLKSYYELEETEAFFSLLEATRKYIRRNHQLSDYQKQSNASFLKLAGKLYAFQLRAGGSRREKLLQQLSQLEKELEKPGAISNKGWLRQKIRAERERWA